MVPTDRQADNPIFYKVEIYLDRLLLPEILIISNFVKIFNVVLEICDSCAHGETDRQPDILQISDVSRSFSRARNIHNTNFCENRKSGSRDLRQLCLRTDRQTKLIFTELRPT